MSTGRPPPGSIPTLTEVVSWPAVAPPVPTPVPAPPVAEPMPTPVPSPTVAEPVAAAAPAASPSVPAPAAPAPAATVAAPTIDEAALRERLLGDIQRQVDLMLEVRLREALAPALARATDALVRDARKELTSTLRDVVSKSVAQALARRDDS